jgi:lysophospholipase L1-like esterase
MKTLVCLGDSLTEGRIGASYVGKLRDALAPQVRVVNAGIDGDTTLNLLRRIDRDVTPHRPDLVTVLVGLNDIGTVYTEPVQQTYYRLVKRIVLRLTPRRFARLYRRLIHALRERTGATIALCTLTALGEDPDAPAQHVVDAYSYIVRALALELDAPLIDVRAAFAAAVAADPRPGPPYKIWLAPLDGFQVAMRGQSYAQIAERRGFRLLCDGVHLAENGAALVAETMLPEVRRLLR